MLVPVDRTWEPQFGNVLHALFQCGRDLCWSINYGVAVTAAAQDCIYRPYTPLQLIEVDLSQGKGANDI